MNYKHYALTYGYAESQSLTTMLLKHHVGFEDPLEAVKHLNSTLRLFNEEYDWEEEESLWSTLLLHSDIDSIGDLWDYLYTNGWEFCEPCHDSWVRIYHAENLMNEDGFYISYQGVDLKYIRPNEET